MDHYGYEEDTLKSFMGGAAIEFMDLMDKHGNKRVVRKMDGCVHGFPTKHRNTHVWVILEDGSAVAMNENPATGLSFPRVGKRTMQKYYPTLMAELEF